MAVQACSPSTTSRWWCRCREAASGWATATAVLLLAVDATCYQLHKRLLWEQEALPTLHCVSSEFSKPHLLILVLSVNGSHLDLVILGCFTYEFCPCSHAFDHNGNCPVLSVKM